MENSRKQALIISECFGLQDCKSWIEKNKKRQHKKSKDTRRATCQASKFAFTNGQTVEANVVAGRDADPACMLFLVTTRTEKPTVIETEETELLTICAAATAFETRNLNKSNWTIDWFSRRSTFPGVVGLADRW